MAMALLLGRMVLVAFVVTVIAEGVAYYRNMPMSVRGIQRSTAIGIGTALITGWLGWLS